MLAREEAFAELYGHDQASQLSIQSLVTRRDALVEEMEQAGLEAPMVQEIDVVFEGRPVDQHRIEAAFLSTMLKDLQKVVNAILASSVGRRARKGKHTKEVQKRGALVFAGAFEGSFGMRLESAETALQFDDVGSVAHTLQTLVKLLGSKEDADELLESLAPLSSRARSEYMDLLKDLSSSGATMKVHSTTMDRVSAVISSRKARRVLDRISRVKQDEQLLSYRGRLDGAMKTRGLFEFRTEDGRVFSGAVSQHAAGLLRDYFDRECIAQITTRVVTDLSTGDQSIFHRLEDLNPVDGSLLDEREPPL